MKTLTKSESLRRGYKYYLIAGIGYQAVQEIADLPDNGEEWEEDDLDICEIEAWHPTCISSEELKELIAEKTWMQVYDEIGDDSNKAESIIKNLDLDFSPIISKVQEAINSIYYYKNSGIKLIPDN